MGRRTKPIVLSPRGCLIQMEGYAGIALTNQLAYPSTEGYAGLEHRKTSCNLPLDATRRPRNTPIWKLEAALK